MLFTTVGIGTEGLRPQVIPVPPNSWISVTSAWWKAQGLLHISGSGQPGGLKGWGVLQDTLQHILQQWGELTGGHAHCQGTVTSVCTWSFCYLHISSHADSWDLLLVTPLKTAEWFKIGWERLSYGNALPFCESKSQPRNAFVGLSV